MLFTKTRTLPALLLAAALSLSGCAGGGSQATTGSGDAAATAASLDDKTLPRGVEVDFWHIQATIYGDAIKEMVKEFNATNEWGIVVTESFKGSYQELNQAIRASLAGGGAPDVAMAYENDTLEYLNAGEIVPLDGYLESKKYGVDDAQLQDLIPGVLARQRVDAYEGRTLSWPHGNSAQGLYVNKDLFTKAGLAGPPKDWDELLSQARQVKQTTGLPYVAIGTGKVSWYYNILRSKGSSLYDPAAGTTDFASPESVEALELMSTLFSEQLAYTAKDTEQEFTNQRVPVELATTARTATKIDQIGDSFSWTVALPPQETERSITQLYGGNHVLMTSNDDQQLAGWLFMRWFAGEQAQSIYAARTGYSPAVNSALKTPLLSADYAKNPQKAEVFENVFTKAQIVPPTAAGNALEDMVNGVVEEVVLGRVTPQDAAKRLDAGGASLLAAQKKQR